MSNKIWDIVKTVGSGFIKDLPMGETILAGVNALLPDDKKLSDESTGEDVQNVISTLTPEQQAQVLSLEYEVDLTQIRESHSTLREMIRTSDNPQSTRPKIALEASRFCYFITFLVAVPVLWAAFKQDTEMMTAIGDSWALLLGLPTIFVGWVNAYFGVLRDEHANGLNASNGVSAKTGGVFKRLFK